MLVVKPTKENGVKQRADILLNLSVAYAIKKYIFNGGNINPKKGYFYVYVNEGGTNKPIKIRTSTYYSWIRRGNVIPETGQTFKRFINEVFTEYRTEKNIKKVEEMIDEAEEALLEISRIHTKIPLRDKSGNEIKDNKKGGVVKVESPELLKIKLDLSKFVLERLDPVKYNNKFNIKTEYKEVLLSDLSKNR